MDRRPIRIFVSATADLEREREAVGEALAKFPVPLPWEIKRTPKPGEQSPAATGKVKESDFYLVLLGQDITAPVGAELDVALRSDTVVIALTKKVVQTLAARHFRFNVLDRWESFSDVDELRGLVVHRLAKELVDRSPGYSVTADELAGLIEYLQEEREQHIEGVAGKREPSGAQDGAIIVSPSGE